MKMMLSNLLEYYHIFAYFLNLSTFWVAKINETSDYDMAAQLQYLEMIAKKISTSGDVSTI